MEARFTRTDTGYLLTLERRLAHAPDKVWRALTQPEFLRRWFPCNIEGEWRVGAPLRFHFRDGEGDGLPEEWLLGEVLEVQPERVLAFRWGTHVLRAELHPVDEGAEGCRLVFSESLDDPSQGARNGAGWDLCLDRLGMLLETGTLAKVGWDAWKSRFEHYVRAFEPEFGSQVGPPEAHPAAEA
jgi:uncharacterized protein YndB with AHSA1/START domain